MVSQDCLSKLIFRHRPTFCVWVKVEMFNGWAVAVVRMLLVTGAPEACAALTANPERVSHAKTGCSTSHGCTSVVGSVVQTQTLNLNAIGPLSCGGA